MKEKIKALLKKRNAILLAHNYQPPEIQDIADLTGDSLELSIKAAKTDADIIVFCGVHFMAETASILSPNKTVLLPKLNAGCEMADMISVETLKVRLKTLPKNIPVVTYVNSPAEVKALSTICCTSANAVEVVKSLNADEVLMTPDKNLALYVASKTNCKIHLWEGYCPIHNKLTPELVRAQMKNYPDAKFIAHPECPPQILALAHEIKSTSGMMSFVKTSEAKSFIIGTEIGLLYPLRRDNPDKTFYPASPTMECPDMKKIKLQDIVSSLETLQPVVKVPDNVRIHAMKSVRRMIELSA